jgi:signal transduction histidine kinase
MFSKHELGLLDAPPEPGFDNLTRLASAMLKTPVSLVSILDFPGDRQFFKSQVGLAAPWSKARQTPLSHSFCQQVVRSNDAVVVEDARIDARFCDNLAIPDLSVVAYLGVPIHDPKGPALGALCVIGSEPRRWTDEETLTLRGFAACATDQIRLKSALLTSERLRREQRDFAYALSHDLRAPANTVHLILGEITLEGEKLSPPTRDLLAEGIATLDRMGRQVEDVLAYTRALDHHRNSTIIDLSELVDEVLCDLRAEIKQRQGHVERAPLPRVPGVRTQLGKVFLNLLCNALKFQPPGQSAEVRIWAEPEDDEGLVTIRVRDNGIGIAPKDQGKVFDLFTRLNHQEDYDGTGIGLSLCRRVAEAHGGRLTLDSDGRTGTTFSLHLPAGPA